MLSLIDDESEIDELNKEIAILRKFTKGDEILCETIIEELGLKAYKYSSTLLSCLRSINQKLLQGTDIREITAYLSRQNN